MMERITEFVQEHKATLVRVGAAAAGALVGAMVAAAFVEEDDYMLEDGLDNFEDAVEDVTE